MNFSSRNAVRKRFTSCFGNSGGLLVVLATVFGCGGDISYRNVDSPAGYQTNYGAPKNKVFKAQPDLDKDVLRLRLYETSECDVLKVRITQRVRQTLKGDEVVHSDPATPIQYTEGITGTVPCDQTYARDVLVSLKVGETTHRLGYTAADGQLNVNLSAELRQSLFAENTPQQATIVVDWQDRGRAGRSEAGTLSLSELRKYEARIDALIAELAELLSTPAQSEPKNILRAYMLYEQLHQLDAGDARIAAVQTRFLELFYQRKAQEQAEQVKRNLKILSEARELLKAGATGVPLYVQTAVYGQTPTQAALEWALGHALIRARSTPALCNDFSWSTLDGGNWDATTRFALSYLRYGYGDGFAGEMNTMCNRLRNF